MIFEPETTKPPVHAAVTLPKKYASLLNSETPVTTNEVFTVKLFIKAVPDTYKFALNVKLFKSKTDVTVKLFIIAFPETFKLPNNVELLSNIDPETSNVPYTIVLLFKTLMPDTLNIPLIDVLFKYVVPETFNELLIVVLLCSDVSPETFNELLYIALFFSIVLPETIKEVITEALSDVTLLHVKSFAPLLDKLKTDESIIYITL